MRESRRVAELDGNYVGKLERGVIRWPQEDYRTGLRAVLGARSDTARRDRFGAPRPGRAPTRLSARAARPWGGWYAVPRAHADTGGCPDDIAGAATDAEWAADRIASIADEKLTAGLYFDSDGMSHSYDSQKGTDADTALKVGREAGVFPQSGRPNVVDHVEVKVAAAMREAGETVGVLVINNTGGPCLVDAEGTVAPMSCLAYLPKLLPAGASLTVWWPDPAGGAPRTQTFVGDQP